jgi:hypothetical protein
MRIVRSSSASACILFAFFVDYFSVPPVRIAKFPIAVVLRSILCMALWSPAVSSCRSQALLHGLAVQKRKTRADDDDNGEDGEDISNALNTSITDLVDHNALAK